MADDKGKKPEELAALEQLLETYGADRTRWPAEARLRLAPLLVADAEAQRLLREAAALDRLLDAAPTKADVDVEALARRVMAAAAAEGQAKIVGLPSRSAAPLARPAARRPAWPVALAMAASFAVGIVLGARGYADDAMAPVVQAFLPAGSDETDETVLAFGVETEDAFEEEL